MPIRPPCSSCLPRREGSAGATAPCRTKHSKPPPRSELPTALPRTPLLCLRNVREQYKPCLPVPQHPGKQEGAGLAGIPPRKFTPVQSLRVFTLEVQSRMCVPGPAHGTVIQTSHPRGSRSPPGPFPYCLSHSPRGRGSSWMIRLYSPRWWVCLYSPRWWVHLWVQGGKRGRSRGDAR